jgi:hypothetical protein
VAAVTNGDIVFGGLVGFVIVLALIVVWRVVVHDETIRKIRFGVFYERERDEKEEAWHDAEPDHDPDPANAQPPKASSG